MNKEEFLRSKLKNFTLFVEKNIGSDNEIYRDLLKYEKNFDGFLKSIIDLSSYAKKKEDKFYFEEQTIVKYLQLKGVVKSLTTTIIDKINQYFSMFLTVLNA